LKKAGLLAGQTPNVTRKGTGFVQPLQAHQEWHVDVSYLNIAGTFYFLCSILDGYSRFIVHWEIRDKMEEIDVETILQRAREKFANERPRIITDNGPQFIAKDFKEFIRVAGMTTCEPRPITPSPTASSNAFTKPSRASASASKCRCHWMTRDASSPITSSITTMSACTAPSATSRPTTNCSATTLPSLPHATANSLKPANAASRCAKPGTSRPRPSRMRHARPSTSPPSAPPSPSPRC